MAVACRRSSRFLRSSRFILTSEGRLILLAFAAASSLGCAWSVLIDFHVFPSFLINLVHFICFFTCFGPFWSISMRFRRFWSIWFILYAFSHVLVHFDRFPCVSVVSDQFDSFYMLFHVFGRISSGLLVFLAKDNITLFRFSPSFRILCKNDCKAWIFPR